MLPHVIVFFETSLVPNLFTNCEIKPLRIVRSDHVLNVEVCQDFIQGFSSVFFGSPFKKQVKLKRVCFSLSIQHLCKKKKKS